jgi:hypothetical protein
MGEQTKADVVSIRVTDGDRVGILPQPGRRLYAGPHRRFLQLSLPDRVFTGDTLLIRGTGRRISERRPARPVRVAFSRLLKLPD